MVYLENDSISPPKFLLKFGSCYDWILTHSRDHQREYGHHANHAETEAVITSLVRDGTLGRGLSSIAYFCYSAICGGGGRATAARLNASHFLPLEYDELQCKVRWCKSVPDPDNLKNLGWPCPNPDAFDGDNLSLPRPFVPGG